MLVDGLATACSGSGNGLKMPSGHEAEMKRRGTTVSPGLHGPFMPSRLHSAELTLDLFQPDGAYGEHIFLPYNPRSPRRLAPGRAGAAARPKDRRARGQQAASGTRAPDSAPAPRRRRREAVHLARARLAKGRTVVPAGAPGRPAAAGRPARLGGHAQWRG